MENTNNVHIYTTPTCVYCNLTKDFFKQNHIQYSEFNVASDMEKRKEMIEKSGQMGVPVIEVGNDLIVGFDKPRLSKALRIQ